MPDLREPEWTATNINRKQGDTTFKTCGWCKHVGCGQVRYGCHLDGYCELIEDIEDIESDQTTWDRKCMVADMGSDDIEAEIRHKKYEIEDTIGCLKRIKDEMKTLTALKKKAKWIPPQPDNRKCEHFDIRDRVWVFDDQENSSGVWESAVVVSGYRHQDGCVSFVIDGKPGKTPGCGTAVPCVLLDKEFKFFRNNLSIFKQWLDRANREYNGEKLPMNKYYEAMVKQYTKTLKKENK